MTKPNNAEGAANGASLGGLWAWRWGSHALSC
jgi:hypothetical protein